MVATRVTGHLATISAALRPSIVVLEATRKMWGWSLSGAVSWSVLGMGAMKTILFSLATTETAGPSAEVSVPTRKSTFSLRISSRATRTASLASALESRSNSSTLRPSTPPLALSSSTNICAPFVAGSPKSAGGPESGIGIPTLIGFCASATSGSASNAVRNTVRTCSMREPPCVSTSVSPRRPRRRSERRQPRDAHADAVHRGRRRDVEGPKIVVAESHVRRVLRHPDDAQVDRVGCEHVDPARPAAVDVTLRVQLHPVGRARAFALRLRPHPAAGERAVSLHVEDADVLAGGVVDEEALAVEREAEPVRPVEIINEQRPGLPGRSGPEETPAQEVLGPRPHVERR